MLPIVRYYLRLAGVLVIPGALLGWYGLYHMRIFFQKLPEVKVMTVRLLMVELVVPHTMFLFGFGGFVFGMLLLIKGAVFHFHRRRIDAETR